MTEAPLQVRHNLTAVINPRKYRLDSPAPSPLVCGKCPCGGHGREFPGTIARKIHSAAIADSKFGR